MKNIDIHQYIWALRLQLLDMSRVSQRTVDYSIKGYKMGSLDFCTNVRIATQEINALHLDIAEISGELPWRELSAQSDLRFVRSAVRICSALHAVHMQAVGIATNCVRLLENGRIPLFEGLTKMGEMVNCQLRLCIIALFDEKAAHAKTVLRNRGVERMFELAFYGSCTSVNRRLRTQSSYELAIATSLRQMAKEAYEIAAAIVFWLEGTDRRLILDANWEAFMLADAVNAGSLRRNQANSPPRYVLVSNSAA